MADFQTKFYYVKNITLDTKRNTLEHASGGSSIDVSKHASGGSSIDVSKHASGGSSIDVSKHASGA